MGKGDIKTRRGKRAAGSYGVSRPQKVKKAESATAKPKPKKAAPKKKAAGAKASSAKKTTAKSKKASDK